MNLMFPSIGNVIIPTDFHFFRGVGFNHQSRLELPFVSCSLASVHAPYGMGIQSVINKNIYYISLIVYKPQVIVQ